MSTKLRAALPLFAVALVAVAIAVLGKTVEVWAGHPEFPSGHMSFVAALGTGALVTNQRAAPVLIPAWLAVAAALVGAGFHTLVEVLAGFALGASVGVLGSTGLKRARRGRAGHGRRTAGRR